MSARHVGAGVLVGLISALFLLPGADAQIGRPFERGPDVTAELVGGGVRLGEGAIGTFRILVRLPPSHHGYLNRGDSGFLIPLTFTFTELEKHGVTVSMVSGPSGQRDETVRAVLVRERAEFVFRVQAAKGRVPASGSLTRAWLDYQICDERVNICYPPRRLEIPVRFIGSTGR